MRTLLIPIGNDLRRDDGVAHAVLQRIDPGCDFEVRAAHQLTPELAAEMAEYDAVWFLDADAGAAQLSVAAVSKSPMSPSLTHVATPEQVVELSRELFSFTGRAFLCRIPVSDLSFGEGLSRTALELAGQAAGIIEIFLKDPRHSFAHSI